MITLYFHLDLDLPLDLLCPNSPLLFLRLLFSMTRACVSLPTKSIVRISSLNRLFLTIANVTFLSVAEFPKDTTKVFQLSGNESSSKHVRVSSSTERPVTDNCAIIPLYNIKYYEVEQHIIGFPKHPMFPHSLYPYIEPQNHCSTVLTSLHTPYSLYKSVSFSLLFLLMTQNIYNDIPNYFSYFTRKLNITII